MCRWCFRRKNPLQILRTKIHNKVGLQIFITKFWLKNFSTNFVNEIFFSSAALRLEFWGLLKSFNQNEFSLKVTIFCLIFCKIVYVSTFLWLFWVNFLKKFPKKKSLILFRYATVSFYWVRIFILNLVQFLFYAVDS